MSGDPIMDKTAPRPPWWHMDLSRRVDGIDQKVETLIGVNQRTQGMLRLATAIGTTLIVIGTILTPIIYLLHK